MKILKFDYKHIDLVWGSEDWIISAHENGMATVKGTDLTLKEMFKQKPEMFGNLLMDEFPLLMKVIDAKTPLSVQVHPGDDYAKEHENSLGKTECWYILDNENSDIIIGQNAASREELAQAIAEDKIEDKLNIFDVNNGDFFYIPAGTVHAIRSNTKILEIQQSSDITYRLFDYHRKDAEGNERELHVDKSLDVINYDYKYTPQVYNSVNGATTLIESEFFNVYKLDFKKEYRVQNNSPFIIGYVLAGDLVINDEVTNAGEAFLIPCGENLEIKGDGEVIISCL